MIRLRLSALPALLLALASGSAAVVAEAAHSRAHRSASLTPTSHDHGVSGPLTVLDHGHESGDHAHADLRALAPTNRTELPAMVPARGWAGVDLELPQDRRLTVAIGHGLAPPEQAQAPPPPSRAPPHA